MRSRLFLALPLILLLAACTSREAEWTKAMAAGQVAYDSGDFREAVSQYTRALDASATLDPQDQRVADNLTRLAQAHLNLGELTEAELLYRRDLDLERKLHGIDSEQVATTLNNLGSIYQDVGRVDESEAAYNEALKMREKVLGPDHPEYADTLVNFASLRRQMGRDAEAEEMDKRALGLCLKAKQQRCVATVYDNLGSLYFEKARLAEALDVYTKGRATWKTVEGGENLDYAVSTANLARVYAQQEHYKDAESLLAEALPIFEMSYGKDGAQLAGYYKGYAKLLTNLNRRDEAEAYERKATAIEALNSRP